MVLKTGIGGGGSGDPVNSVPWSAIDEVLVNNSTDQIMMYRPSEPFGQQNARLKLSALSLDTQDAHDTQIIIHSQQDLEDVLDSDLIIPNNTNITIDASKSTSIFFTKPIKIGNNSSLKFTSSVTGTVIVYTGTGAFIRLLDDTKPCFACITEKLTIVGVNTNYLYALKGSLFVIQDVFPANFNGIGITEFAQYRINGLNPQPSVNFGLTIIGAVVFTSNACFINRTGSTHKFILFSFLNNLPVAMGVNELIFAGATSGDSLLYYDPNSIEDTSIVVTACTKESGKLYNVGNLKSAVVIGAGTVNTNHIKISIPSAHDYSVGQVIKLEGFTIVPAYNKSVVISSIENISIIEVDMLFAGIDIVGFSNTKSLNSKDVRVLASDNPKESDSMFTAKASLQLSASINIGINVAGTPEVVTDNNWNYNKLERFEEDTVTPNQGRVITKSKSTKKYSITYSGTIKRGGGGGADIGLVLLVDGNNVSINPPRIFEPNASLYLSRTEIIELSENQIPQIAVVNYLGTEVIEVSQLDMSINKA